MQRVAAPESGSSHEQNAGEDQGDARSADKGDLFAQQEPGEKGGQADAGATGHRIDHGDLSLFVGAGEEEEVGDVDQAGGEHVAIADRGGEGGQTAGRDEEDNGG